MRRLRLHRETIRVLTDESLQFVVGGTSSNTAVTCVSVGCPPPTAPPTQCVDPKHDY